MQFSLRRLFVLTAIVALMFGRVGRYWPLGTAVAVVGCVGAGIALLAFGTIKSWKLVVWVFVVFLGSLVSIRFALHLNNMLPTWSRDAVEACSLLTGAVLSGGVTALVLTFLARKPVANRLEDTARDKP
ncbi:MAG: hypothetical protein JW888_09060 [Pirellulales bacterium]|nr:hypothetical protein [Pirellulales bacterium]